MKTRFLLILISILALGLIVVAMTQAVGAFRTSNAIQNADAVDLDRSFVPPEFTDVVEEDGTLIVSGRAEPGASLSIRTPQERLRTVLADEDGSWTASVAVPSAQVTRLQVESFIDDLSLSGDQSVLRIPAPGAEDGIAQRPLIMLTSPGGPSRIVQTPFGTPLTKGALTLDAIEYDRAGGTIFAGRADAGSTVELSSGEQALGVVPVAPDGRWFSVTVAAQPEADRAYTLRSGDDAMTVAFAPLAADQDTVRDADMWQIRRSLPGGGSQVTVVFATPATSSGD